MEGDTTEFHVLIDESRRHMLAAARNEDAYMATFWYGTMQYMSHWWIALRNGSAYLEE